MRFLILEQQRDAPAQLFADWAVARGHELGVALVPELTRWPDSAGFDALVSLGSDASVPASPHSWIADELEFLRRAHAREVPILGICFGGQALAQALGGSVARAPAIEVSWRVIDTAAPELIPGGPWFRWHEDQFIAPPGSRILAPADAFALNRSLGLQFHPEVDSELAERWLAGRAEDLSARGVDVDALRRQIAAHAPRAQARAFDLFDRIVAWWGGARGAPIALATQT